METHEPLNEFIARAEEAFAPLWALLQQELTEETVREVEAYFFKILIKDPSLANSLDAAQIRTRIQLKKASFEAMRTGAVQLEPHETPKGPTHPAIMEIIRESQASTHPILFAQA